MKAKMNRNVLHDGMEFKKGDKVADTLAEFFCEKGFADKIEMPEPKKEDKPKKVK